MNFGVETRVIFLLNSKKDFLSYIFIGNNIKHLEITERVSDFNLIFQYATDFAKKLDCVELAGKTSKTLASSCIQLAIDKIRYEGRKLKTKGRFTRTVICDVFDTTEASMRQTKIKIMKSLGLTDELMNLRNIRGSRRTKLYVNLMKQDSYNLSETNKLIGDLW